MWKLYLTSKTLSQRPSDLLCVPDRWLAYQLDNAVVYLGITLENALHETINAGTERQSRTEPKYTITQLLEPSFRLPAPEKPQQQKGGGLAALLALAGRRGMGVTLWKEKTPENST